MIANGKQGNSTLTGIAFEKKTDLRTALLNAGYKINLTCFCAKNAFIKKMEEKLGSSIYSIWSKKLLPDECLILGKNVYIIEKKYQQTPGSVDEKPQTVAFKKYQYDKLAKATGLTFHFCYLFNDWFLDNKYTDMLDFIEISGCSYFFNEIPIDYFKEIELYVCE